ncbi:MAG: TIGR03936 family radical SAM-associated protein [Isosphaeraceae bacterium]|nr:TIGR03936 family radical SAM-associated protein [Isosphaeraceae bacterium]
MTAATPKVRLRFAKHGDLRLISHHDLVRSLERMIRRADLPIASTQGFNPRPKITFSLSLALGIEGKNEAVEFEFTEPLEPGDVLERLRAESPAGLEWLCAEPASGKKVAQAEAVAYSLPIPEDRIASTRESLASILGAAAIPYSRQRPDRIVQLDVRPFLLDADVDSEGHLRFRLSVTNAGTAARPEDIIDLLGLGDLLDLGAVLVRTDVELAS